MTDTSPAAVERAKYDMSIHSNPDAAAWSAFFKETFPDSDENLMHGWFANAMMAMRDHMQGKVDAANQRHAAALEAVNRARDAALVEAAKAAYVNRAHHNVVKSIFALRTQAPEPAHPDDTAVDRFATSMKAKLKYSREEKGRGGWNDTPAEALSLLLREHVDKGDPLDVGNFAMMLHQRGDKIEPARVTVQEAGKPSIICLPYPMHGYGVCIGGHFNGWLMWQHPDGQWITKSKLTLVDPLRATKGGRDE